MKNFSFLGLFATVFLAACFVYSPGATMHPPSIFRVLLPSSLTEPVNGRLLLFMKCGNGDQTVDVDLFHPESTWIVAQEVRGLFTVGNDELGLFDEIGRQMYASARK